MKMVLITVTSMTSPSTRNPARIMTSPSRTQTQKGGAGRLVTPIGELLSYVVMSISPSDSNERMPVTAFDVVHPLHQSAIHSDDGHDATADADASAATPKMTWRR